MATRLPRTIEVRRVDVRVVSALRARLREGVQCQIVHDSILPRGLADPYLVLADGDPAGYGAVWNQYHPGRVVEFETHMRSGNARTALFAGFLAASGASEMEAQTNLPGMLQLLEEFGSEPVEEKILFHEGDPTNLSVEGASFRRRRDGDGGPDGDWVIELDGEVVAAGGVMTHYNPPHGDLHMEVSGSHRRQGLGSFIVQELRRVCRASGLVPAARCDPANLASWRALERGGMVECGRLLSAVLERPIDRGGA